MTDPGQASSAHAGAGGQTRAAYEEDLDDAVYYIGHGCLPCAERCFEKARRHGADEAQIEAARLSAQH